MPINAPTTPGVYYLNTAEDFGQLEYMHTHEGRFPQADNEIALPLPLAQQMGKQIGDRVMLLNNIIIGGWTP